MSRHSLFAQVLLCIGLVLGEELAGTFGIGGIQPIFQKIKALPRHQHGFIITQPNDHTFDSRVLTQEQQIQLKTQESFRKAVEEANRLRINGGLQQVEFGKENPELLPQLVPLEEDSVQQSASEKFESRSLSAELTAPVADDDISSKSQFDAKKLREQAENARYSFKSSVADSINDHSHIRQEVREGLKLKGHFSYSDGYFKRTVHYVADEDGYRVISEQNEPIGTGPQINPLGQVDVSSQIDGRSLEYTIKGENLPAPVQNKTKINKS